MIRFSSVLTVPVVVIAGLSIAPTAAADCTSAGGTTICAQGESRGANTGAGPGTGPYVPYPCEYDWNCSDYYGWDLDLDWDPGLGVGGPGGPGVGLPGTPGNRPGGGGRPGGGRGGGGRR